MFQCVALLGMGKQHYVVSDNAMAGAIYFALCDSGLYPQKDG
jgi:hypothetical protein